MDEQVKARLIGATVLVVIAVALVPELLSGPKHVATTGSPVEPGRNRRTVTIDLSGAAGASKVPVTPAATEPATREPVPLPNVKVPGAAAETGAGIEPSAESIDPPADVATTEPLPTPPTTVASTQPTSTKSVPAATSGKPLRTTASAAAPAVASSKTAGSSTAPSATPTAKPATEASHPPATPVAASQGGWSVQVGAFGSADAARKLVGELKKDGLAAYVAPLDRGGKTLHRVRVGPAPSKAEAEKLATRLKAKGLSGSVVPPQ